MARVFGLEAERFGAWGFRVLGLARSFGFRTQDLGLGQGFGF